MKILNEPTMFAKETILNIEREKDAKFVCETNLKTDIITSVFYSKEPHPVSNSHYFGMYLCPFRKQVFITSAAIVEELKFAGAVADNGDIIYSRYRHDYRISPDKSVMIDGGRDYIKTNTDRIIQLIVSDGELKVKRK